MRLNELIQQWIAWKSQKEGDRYTQKRLSIDAGISENLLSKISMGRVSDPKSSTIESISKALGISVSEFWAGPEKYILHTKELHEFEPGESIPGLGTMLGTIDMSSTVPLLTSIPAGDWKEWHDPYPPGIGEGKVPRYGLKGEHVVALRVNGDSMIGEGLHEGDILYINPELPFTAPRSGRIGVVRYNGGYKIRRVFLSGDGQKYRLVPANPDYQEEEIPVKKTTVFKIVRWMPNTEGMF